MDLKGKQIRSKASGMIGEITGFNENSLLITFTNMQDIAIPLAKAEVLLDMDEDVLQELRTMIKGHKGKEEHCSKVQTYMDDFEEDEDEESEEEDLEDSQEDEDDYDDEDDE